MNPRRLLISSARTFSLEAPDHAGNRTFTRRRTASVRCGPAPHARWTAHESDGYGVQSLGLSTVEALTTRSAQGLLSVAAVPALTTTV